jgi:AcrR family transcriptional regulator
MITPLTRHLLSHGNEIPVNDSDFAPSAGASLANDRAERIVVAALAEFSENGYSGTRLESVARRAGISKPTLLRHFTSKDEIFREVVRSTLVGCMEPLHEQLAHTNGGPVSAVEQIREFATSYWTMMRRPALTQVLRLSIGELPRFPELAVFQATETLERSLRALERIIQSGIARGELHPHDARASARTVLATVAAHALWFAEPEIYAGVTGSDREQAAQATIESLVAAIAPVRDGQSRNEP